MNDKAYLTVAAEAQAELEEKRSRFLSFVSRVTTDAEATAFVSSVRARFPDARHAVYAYVASSSGTLAQRYSDDGEPQGTAGLPVLDVIRKRELTDTAIVVVRYFGGILLGAPGLVRAYSGAASLAVNAAGIVRMTPLASLHVSVSYQNWQRVENAAARMGLALEEPSYAEEVSCVIGVAPGDMESVQSALRDACAGRIAMTVGGVRFVGVPVTPGEKEV